MDIENIVGVWPNVAIVINDELINKAECDTREHMDNDIYVHMRPNDSREQIAELQKEIARLRKVCQTQANSFASMENENAALRSRLNRIRELAERPKDA